MISQRLIRATGMASTERRNLRMTLLRRSRHWGKTEFVPCWDTRNGMAPRVSHERIRYCSASALDRNEMEIAAADCEWIDDANNIHGAER